MVGGLGIAFFLIFVACTLLLFLTENDRKLFWIKAAGMLFLFLLLFVLYSIFTTGRIRQMFVPLDRIAYGLMQDQIFVDSGEKDLKALADSLRSQAEQMSELSRELKYTQENLDDAHQESRASRDDARQKLGRTVAEMERICKREEEIQTLSGKIEDSVDEALLLESGIKSRRDGLYDHAQRLKEHIRENMQAQADTETEFQELGGSYSLLESMHSEAEELVDSIYNDMTALQSLATQVNLYVMNTSLDMSRAGAVTISAISAMDEIKELSARINEKTDSVLLLIIRVRNSLKLAMDQTGECREKSTECAGSFSKAKDELEELGEQIRILSDLGGELSDDAGRLSSGLYEVKLMEQNRGRQEEALGADVERLTGFVRDWRSGEGGSGPSDRDEGEA